MNGWIGVDFDRTLVTYDSWKGHTHIGGPIWPMIGRVQGWINEGREVRIFTARVSHDGTAERMLQVQEAAEAISDWCVRMFDQALPITCVKDWHMYQLWDDRAVQVEPNTGLIIGRILEH